MSYNIFKILFPGATEEQLMATKSRSIVLKTYNKRIILQLGIWSLAINNNKQKMCQFFVVPEHCPALLGMLYIETLGILIINCNTFDTQADQQKVGRQMVLHN